MTTPYTPKFVLHAQHGWADDHREIASLAHSLAASQAVVVTPSLGYVKTWLRIEPLIAAVEAIAAQTLHRHPDVPMRIVGHSMGGLIWLEVLDRHPEWRSQVESLVLVGSPVGGADLARILDPFAWGIGIARDLGKNRRAIAEDIAAEIPTLVIAGDVDGGSDGTITIESAKVHGAQFVRLPGIAHAKLKNHPAVAETIHQFWQAPQFATAAVLPHTALIRRLQQIPGMTDASPHGFSQATPYLHFENGITIRLWKNAIGVQHVFVACPNQQCLYSGFVGWIHAQSLLHTLEAVRSEITAVCESISHNL
jgi:pimeloyl-ACP methyl ester carboxylesterase